MDNIAITEFLPLMIGAAVVPVWIIIVLLLLRSEGGLLKAVAFVAGQILVRLVQGFVFGFVLGASPAAETEQGAALIVNTLLIVIGILLWITAVLKWLKQGDPDAPPPKWMALFSSISAAKAFGFSIVLMAVAAKQWVFTLGALGVIREADLPSPNNIFAYLIFVLGAQSFVLLPILLTAIAPKQAARWLESGSQWLERNNRTIVVAVSVIFGSYFMLKGIMGWLG